jgi:hypothetical protein
MDKFLVRKKDAKPPPDLDGKVLGADLPPLKHTSLALVRTWAQILFGVSKVTGPHSWFRCAFGCILGVTVFSPYVQTVVEDCVDRILLVFQGMGVKLVKGGETYDDRGDKRPTELPTYNPWVYMFGKAMRLPIMGLTCAAAELIEQCIISRCKKVFVCANQRSPGGPDKPSWRHLQYFAFHGSLKQTHSSGIDQSSSPASHVHELSLYHAWQANNQSTFLDRTQLGQN